MKQKLQTAGRKSNEFCTNAMGYVGYYFCWTAENLLIGMNYKFIVFVEITGVPMRNCMLHYAQYRSTFPTWALAENRKHACSSIPKT
ncbi:hypothetical protein RHMOL_Rhmol02G0262100 [Rhododendron molle]|uniref:Uncharacterized protein n=1 Tax=Rhododendron molle TaxID=49168 RepID=A0ACC0PUS1_RHOML|nr:hypothetical protein RHMOL_Rhmol02G0262100 [Rhododendron molle]